jgi:hypothetical protein
LTPFDLKLDFQPKKSAKPCLIELGNKVLDVIQAPEELDLVVYKYNIRHKLQEEVNKLDEATARKAIEEIKKVMDAWQKDLTT